MPSIERSWAPWLVLLLLPAAVHLPLAFGLSANPLYFYSHLTLRPPDGLSGVPGISDPNAGWTTQALGGLAARQWLHGRMPWWNPYSGVGLPLAAEVQNAALFLPFVLLLAAFDGVALMQIAMQMVAGLASYALLRQLGLGRRASLLGGIFYQLNGTFACMAGAAMMPVPFLPVLLLGIERARDHARRRRAGGWGWISIGLAYSLYAGFPETAFIDGLLALLWAGFRFAQGGGQWRFAAKVAMAGGLGMLLAAPLLLPFWQLLATGDLGIHGLVGGRTGVQALALYPSTYALFLAPYVYGTVGFAGQWREWDAAGGYLGLPLLLLGLLALRRGGRETGLRWMLAAWIVLALAKSAQLPGVAQAADLIPYVRETYFRRYAPPSWEIAAVVLACFALDDWQRGADWRRRLPAAAVACGAALAVSLVPAWPVMLELRHAAADYPAYAAASLIWACLVFAAVVALLKLGPRRGNGLWLLLAGNAAILFMVPLLSTTRPLPLDTAAIGFLQRNLGLGRFFALGASFPPNYGAWFEVASIDDIYLPVPRSWVDYIHARLDPDADGILFDGDFSPTEPGEERRAEALVQRLPDYAALGVRFVVTPSGQDPFPATAPPPVYRDGLVDIYAVAAAAPYFEARGAACTLVPDGRGAVRAACPAPATLVRREMADPGWRVRLNGADASITTIDSIFQAVALPAGDSVLRFAYAPPQIGWARAAFLLGLAGWSIGLVRGWPRT